jgi:YidC/Oxa1 family membrane protein insertase
MFSNFLITLPFFSRLSDLNLNFIGDFIKWLVGIIGSVGFGIVIFTIALKLITLPLDIYSKASMRKNSLKMEKMRPQLEKLKKQYASDKAIYNQKMMALYKKEGYSMFGACLPTIVTLVFFIIVLTAFQSYSKYATLKVFNDMRDSYTQTVELYTETNNINELEKVEGPYFLNHIELQNMIDSGYILIPTQTETQEMITAGYISIPNETDIQKMFNAHNIDELTLQAAEDYLAKEYRASEYIKERAREASAQTFRENDLGFLWVKNIWISDNATSHPIQTYTKFINTVKLSGDDNFSNEAYDELTYNLSEEKSVPNGFFIFIVLSIGVTLLSQWVLGKSQKAQLELQSVDGQGAQTQKMMMYIMPVMIGVFAFMYTSAFCIYMVSNSILTIITTLIINEIVDIKFKSNEAKQETAKLNNKFNRIEGSKNNNKIK